MISINVYGDESLDVCLKLETMKFNKEELIQDLAEQTRINLNKAEHLLTHSLSDLNNRPGEGKWSALESIEHLNLYGEYYIAEIKERLKHAKVETESVFKSGVLGNYFAELIKPKAKINTMKTQEPMNPMGSALDASAVEKFIRQQKQILELLNASREVSLKKTKTSVSISKLIKLRLGDTLRFVVYHNNRHVLQAQNALA